MVSRLTGNCPAIRASGGGSAFGMPELAIGYRIDLIHFVGICATTLPGIIVAWISPERLALIKVVLFAGGLAPLATGQLAAMIFAPALFKISYGPSNPVSSEQPDRVTPLRRRALVCSIKESGGPVGAVAANPGLPVPAPAAGLGWQTALLIFAACGLMLLPVLAVLSRNAPPADIWSRGRRPIERPPGTPMPQAAMLRDPVAGQRAFLAHPVQRLLALLGGQYSGALLNVTARAAVALVSKVWSSVAAGAMAAMMQSVGAVGWSAAADRRGNFLTGITDSMRTGADAYVQSLFYGGVLVVAVSLSLPVRKRQLQNVG